MSLRLPVALSVALTLALPATVHASPQRYADRLATNAAKAPVEDNCLALRSIDLCGYRVRLISRATTITGEAGCHGRECWYEFHGETATTPFFCQGYMVFSKRLSRWMADQAVDCYGDDDPSWYYADDGVIIREP